MRGSKQRAVLAGVAMLCFSGRASASPEDLFGYGARTSAMGATGTAHAEGYETAWHNPALASAIRAPKLTLGFTGGVLRLDASGAGLPGRTSSDPITGTIIGAEIPIPLGGALRQRIGVALAFYEPTDVVVRGRVLYPERTQFPMLDNRAQSVTVRAGLGVDIGHGVRLGAAFAALAEVEGSVVAATDATGRVGTRVEDQLVATYAPVLGVTYDLPLKGPEIWRIGAIYRGKLDARFSIVRVEPLSTIALQVVYKRWSAYPGALEPTVVCSEGGPGACGLTPPRIDFHDTFVIPIGAEQGKRLAPGVTLRGRVGGFFESSPLPGNVPGSSAYDTVSKSAVDVPTRYFDSDRLALSLGVGLSLAKPLPPIDLDLFLQHHYLFARTIRSLDSEGEASGHITLFGLNAAVKF